MDELSKEIERLKAAVGIFQSTVKEHGNSLEKHEKRLNSIAESINTHITNELDRFANDVLKPVISLAVLQGVNSGLAEHIKTCKASNSFPDFKGEVGELRGQVKEASRRFDVERESTTNNMRKRAARGEISLSDVRTEDAKEDIKVGFTIPRGFIKWAIGILVLTAASLFGVKGISYMVKQPGMIAVDHDSEEKAIKTIQLVDK